MPAGGFLGAYRLTLPDPVPELNLVKSHGTHAGGAWECSAAPARCIRPGRPLANESMPHFLMRHRLMKLQQNVSYSVALARASARASPDVACLLAAFMVPTRWRPPSTGSAVPVINAPHGEHRNATASPMSSAVPQRASGRSRTPSSARDRICRAQTEKVRGAKGHQGFQEINQGQR